MGRSPASMVGAIASVTTCLWASKRMVPCSIAANPKDTIACTLEATNVPLEVCCLPHHRRPGDEKNRGGVEERKCGTTEKVKSKVVVGDEKSCFTPIKSKAGGEEKIFVTVRVRPLSTRELMKGDIADWECPNDHTVAFKHPLPERSPYPPYYSFDRVFGPYCPTQRVYEEGAKDVTLSSLTGLNSTIFAYGQTSSGKTYTMKGVIETSVRDIYEFVKKNQERNFILKVSAIEIHNEIVKDLLNPKSSPLRLLDDPKRGTVVERLQEEVVQDASHLRQVLAIFFLNGSLHPLTIHQKC